MTKNEAASVAQGLTDANIRDIWHRTQWPADDIESKAIAFARALLSQAAPPAAPVKGDGVSLQGAANLALNALYECTPNKGAEIQISDAIRALTQALHDIAYTVNRTATPQQFADHLQREARAAILAPPAAPASEPVAWISYDTLTKKERIGRLPVQSLQPGVYKHTPLYATPPAAEASAQTGVQSAPEKCHGCHSRCTNNPPDCYAIGGAWERNPSASAQQDEPMEWRIEVGGPSGYVRFETFQGVTLDDALDSAVAQNFYPAQDEDGWTRIEVKV
jgi:hypothetical protein